MPIYVYRNLVTNETFEHEQRITADALRVDPRTGDPVKRLIQPVGIAFKGSGFYVNDSRGASGSSAKTAAAAAAAAGSSASGGATSSDAAKPSSDAGTTPAPSSTSTSTSSSSPGPAGTSSSTPAAG